MASADAVSTISPDVGSKQRQQLQQPQRAIDAAAGRARCLLTRSCSPAPTKSTSPAYTPLQHSLSKNDAEHIESHDEEKGGVRGRIHSVDDHRHHKHDKALDALGADGRVPMTDEESRMVCRKIDKHIMPILMW